MESIRNSCDVSEVKLQDRLIWVDCEMTGLDVETDALLEIAVVVTEVNLQSQTWHQNAMACSGVII